MTPKGKIIFVNADQNGRMEEEWQLTGYHVIRTESLEQSFDHIFKKWPDILICNVKRAGADILSLLKKTLDIDPALPLILIAEQMDMEVFHIGIHDFVEKPCSTKVFLNRIDRALEKRRLIMENRELISRVLAREEILRDLRNWESRIRRPTAEIAPAQTSPEMTRATILSEQVWTFEKKIIDRELARQKGNIKNVLIGLGLPRQTLYDKMRKYGLKRTDYL